MIASDISSVIHAIISSFMYLMISSVIYTSFINPKAQTNEYQSFLRILLILFGDTSLNPGPVCNNHSLDTNKLNVIKSKEPT